LDPAELDQIEPLWSMLRLHHAGNDEALRFYERHGFGTGAIWMRRENSPSQQ
jgi:hypothetical protein